VNRIAYALLRSGLFTGLSESAFGALVERAVMVEIGEGEIVVREGDAADAAFIVLSGSLRVVTQSVDGDEVVLDTLGPGAHFGEQALLGAAAGLRTATVRGIALRSEVVRIGRDELSQMLADDPALRDRLEDLGKLQHEERLSRRTSLVRALLAGGQTRAIELELDNGDVLYRQGDPPGDVYVILAGQVELLVDRDGLPLRVALVGAGLCVGDRDEQRRAATAVVDGPTQLLQIRREDLQRLTAGSSELGDHLATLHGVWELPQRGFVTQHLGTIDGRECITQLFHLADRRSFVSSHVIGDGAVRFEAAQGEPARNIVTPDGVVRVALEADGRVFAIEAKGSVPVLATLIARAIEGKALQPVEEAELARSGALQDEDAGFVCACMRVQRSAVRRAIAAGAGDLPTLQQRTGCGLSCGACVPSLREMLGVSSFVRVVIDRIDVLTDTVRRVCLSPVQRDPQPLASRPGQHVVLRADIDAVRLERPYTLSSAAGAPWEVTVKREADGRFSSWLFERAKVGTTLESSTPSGEYVWDGGPAPVICFTCGIGVTPALSFARTILREGWPHALVIHWSTRTERDLVILGELAGAQLPNNLTVVPHYTATKGRIGARDVEAWVRRFPSAVYFLCGSQGYMDDVRSWLLAAGVDDARIAIESFAPRAPALPPLRAVSS
jgi:ferredoxin-NADP reductase/CRP-like cAMP-binding protein